jgi:6-phosphogluconate dehydrogenase
MSTTTTTIKTAQFGIIGLGVMGVNLALNIEEHGHGIAVWNLEPERVDSFIHNNPSRQVIGAKSIQEFCRSLERPRRILMMIKAGEPVDQVLQKIIPYLAPGDMLIDGGDSYFKDTIRREAATSERMVKFFGMGVSGGEEGARRGPALMPGGDRQTYQHLEPLLQSIAAKSDSGPCVCYIGPDGAGHFVKMVHNGIEYGDMELIAEAYDVLSRALNLGPQELADIFAEWNRGPLESFLIEITADIFRVADPETGKPLINVILDKAGQKGPGKWTAQAALELGMPVPTIAAAIDARLISGMKEERLIATRLLKSSVARSYSGERRELIQAVHDALYAGKVCCYAQGMSLIRAASMEWQWDVNLRELARIWKGGCIIRARFLDSIMRAYERQPELPNLLLDSEFMGSLRRSEAGWRQAVASATEMGLPVPAFSASLAYFDSYRSEHLPQSLTQAQRDYFGAHGYQRVDRPGAGFVHTDWTSLLPKSTRTSGAK